MIDIPHLRMTVNDRLDNPFGVQWQRYRKDAPYPELDQKVAHIAFEVSDLDAALLDQKVIIAPNNSSAGVKVTFIEVKGAPVELLQVDHGIRDDLQDKSF